MSDDTSTPKDTNLFLQISPQDYCRQTSQYLGPVSWQLHIEGPR